MNNYSTPWFIGLGCGILCAVIVLLIRKILRKNSGPDYDERQKLIRGKSYTIGFYVTILLETAYLYISEFYKSVLVNNSLIQFTILITGLIIAVYIQVWNDAYFSLKENPKRWLGVMAVATVLNILSFIRLTADEGIYHDGALDFACVSLILAVYIIILMILLGIKTTRNKKLEKQEEK